VLWAEHVAWMLEVRYAYRTSVRDSGRDSDRKNMCSRRESTSVPPAAAVRLYAVLILVKNA